MMIELLAEVFLKFALVGLLVAVAFGFGGVMLCIVCKFLGQ